MKKENNPEIPCPCGTGNAYNVCCKPFHQGKLPDNALKLMRSRYSAYALDLPAYIISTTHPANPQYCPDIDDWTQQISTFSSQTEFKGLEILDFQDLGMLATVTFVAYLNQNNNDVSFAEKSMFEKIGGKWLYLNGKVFERGGP